jgi:acetylornithine deacetylase/succinyl-diaminopimelate desuccinylase-like protein
MKRSAWFAAALWCFSHATLAGSLAEQITAASQKNFGEYLELLSIANVADQPSDIQRNAAFLEQSFRKRGFKTQLLNNTAQRPLVFAELERSKKNQATVLFYMHFDGQPVTPEQWAQKSPFEPVVKRRASDGKWAEVSREQLLARPFDPELRVFARSASDDKAPILMLLTAIDVLKGKAPAINVKVLLDSEEEISSPSLAETVQANRALFDADALIVLDGPVHGSGRPTLVFGNRGITQALLTVYGPKAPLHSGHFGNYVPNPAQRLASLLASMKDDDGRVLVPGYYDGIALTAADRDVLKATGDDESALLKRAGIARAERVGENYQEALQYPSLNVRGMASAAVGAKAANIVPSEAVAQRMPMDAPVGRWAMQALVSATAPVPKQDPVRIRMMGGTVPVDVLVNALQLPFLLVPTVNADNNQHAHDENMRMGNFITGTETIYSLLTTSYRR